MSKDNFKMRVVENIGYLSGKIFGEIGNIIEVDDGFVFGLNKNYQFSGITSVEKMNEFINCFAELKTIFELVTEQDDPKIYTSYELEELICEKWNDVKGKKFRIIDTGTKFGSATIPNHKGLKNGDVLYVGEVDGARGILYTSHEDYWVYFSGKVLLEEVDEEKENIKNEINKRYDLIGVNIKAMEEKAGNIINLRQEIKELKKQL